MALAAIDDGADGTSVASAEVTRHATPLVRTLVVGALAGAAWLAAASVSVIWPDVGDYSRTPELATAFAVIGLASITATLASLWSAPLAQRVAGVGPWLLALGIFFLAWEALYCQARLAAAAVLPAAAGAARGLHRRLGEAGLERPAFAAPVGRRLRLGRAGGLPGRCVDRMVQGGSLLAASDPALHRSAACRGVAAARLLRLPVELERERLPDRAGDRISCCHPDVVGHRCGSLLLLRRGAHAGGQGALPRFSRWQCRRRCLPFSSGCSWAWAPRSPCWWWPR